jgi:hypothetical protein
MAMNMKTSKAPFLMLMTLFLATTITVGSAQVFKNVDENGNVVFTDLPPEETSKPMELPPLNVIEAPTYQLRSKVVGEDKNGDGERGNSTADLRKMYADFALISPRSEESVWRPDIVIKAAWKTQTQLQAGMMVNIYVDNELYQTTTQQIVSLGALERGEHTVTAKLVDSMNRNVATTVPIVFYVFQPMNYPVRPKPAPSDG